MAHPPTSQGCDLLTQLLAQLEKLGLEGVQGVYILMQQVLLLIQVQIILQRRPVIHFGGFYLHRLNFGLTILLKGELVLDLTLVGESNHRLNCLHPRSILLRGGFFFRVEEVLIEGVELLPMALVLNVNRGQGILQLDSLQMEILHHLTGGVGAADAGWHPVAP